MDQVAAHETAPSAFSLRRLYAERLIEAHLPILRMMHTNAQIMATLGGVRSRAQTADYLERKGLLSQSSAEDGYDPDGFFLDEGPNKKKKPVQDDDFFFF